MSDSAANDLPLGPHLTRLLADCETVCVAGCCGLDAFDLTPPAVAAACSSGDDEQVDGVRADLTALEQAAAARTADDDGFIGCETDTLNQCFTAASLASFVAAIRSGLDHAAADVPRDSA